MLTYKKLLALCLAMLMIVGLAGCGGSNDPAPETQDPGETGEDVSPTAGDDGLTVHENTFFTVKYDEEAGWSLGEDDFNASESGGEASLRILNTEGDTEILVDIDAYETDCASFRESLHNYGIDEKAYVEGTLATETIGGQIMIGAEDGYGGRDFFGRNEAAGVTYTVSVSDWEDGRGAALLENITFIASGTDNMDPPWYWEGQPFTGGTLSQTVGSHTLTAQFVPIEGSMVTFETFDHDIAVLGDKVYLLSDSVLYQLSYDGAALKLLKEIPLEDEYATLEKGKTGEIVLSGFLKPTITHDGNSVLTSFNGPETLAVAPDGTWGISYFVSGDSCKRYTLNGDASTATDIAFNEVDSIRSITIDDQYILVSGSGDDDEQYVFVYNYDGELKLKLAGEPGGSFGLGSVTYVTSTANGFLALDGNMREVVLWSADGTWLGSVKDDELFGTSYPWFAAADAADDGSILIAMSEERADESADEVLVFKLSGF